tara:strand:+ start:320 stop:1819 length:1500 start_codon:yes stop_codon:yes gene_type:complete
MTALLTILLSFAGAAVCGLMRPRDHRQIRWVALGTSIAGLAVALFCWQRYEAEGGIADLVDIPWIPEMGVSFLTGYDGISLPLLLVTGLVAVCGVLFTWDLKERANEFYAYFLTLIGGVYGVFLSLDLFLLFVFYEIAVVPKYFLIANWGGERREFAAMKLVLYSFAGSALVLLGLLAVYFAAGVESFSLVDLGHLTERERFTPGFQAIVFPILFVGFAILAGMWPFHTWAPTGHVAAPTAASMLLAGVVMKLGAYGCLRVAVGLLPAGAQVWAPLIAVVAIVNIGYGALVALRQNDFKYVIGYSSVSHMGFVLLGIATLHEVGMTGAVLQMFSHGVIGAVLFAMVGTVIYSRTHSRKLDEFSGLIDRMPGIAWVFVIAGLASMGLPGFSGFISELYVLIGVWKSDYLTGHKGWVLVGAGLGILLTFGYTLVKIHEAFFGVRHPDGNGAPLKPYKPMTTPEIIGCAILLGASLLIGLFPQLLTGVIGPSVEIIINRLPG